MRKLLSMLLALAMVLALVPAMADDAYTLDIYWVGNGDNEAVRAGVEAAVNAYIEPLIGAKVSYHIIGWGDWNDKAINALQSGEKMDLIFTVDWEGYGIEVAGGLLQPLDELLAKCWPESMKEIIPDSQMAGGKINGVQYGIPSAYAPSSAMFQFVCLRQDLLEQVGMTEVKTADDLREFAEKVQTQLPTFKGPADIIFKPLTRNFAEEQYTWVASQDLVVFGEESKQAYSYAHTQAFQDVAKFNREMFLDGLYQDEVAIKYNERDSRMQTGLYLWVEGSLGKENEISGSVKTADPDAVLKNYLLAEEKPRYINATGGEVLCIPYSAKNPEGALKFLAWLWGSQDNYLFCLYGEKGKDWDLDENGGLQLISETAAGEGFFYEWMFRNANYQVFGPEVTEEYKEMYRNWDNDAQISAMMGFAFNNTGFEVTENACLEAWKKLAPIMYGYVDFDENYPAAIAELEAAGINEYVDEMNRQLDAFLASK